MSLNLFLTSHPLDAERHHRHSRIETQKLRITFEMKYHSRRYLMMISSKRKFSPLDAAWLSSWFFTAEITAEFVHRLALLFILKQENKNKHETMGFWAIFRFPSLYSTDIDFYEAIYTDWKFNWIVISWNKFSFSLSRALLAAKSSEILHSIAFVSLPLSLVRLPCTDRKISTILQGFCLCMPANLFLPLIYMVLGFN